VRSSWFPSKDQGCESHLNPIRDHDDHPDSGTAGAARGKPLRVWPYGPNPPRLAAREGLTPPPGTRTEEQKAQEATLLGEIETLKKKQASRLKVLDLAPNVEVVAQELSAIQQQIDTLEAQRQSINKVPLTGGELDRATDLFKRHYDLAPGPEREELRERMKVAINRQVRKFEFYSNVDEASHDGLRLIEFTRAQYDRDPRYKVSEHPQFIVGLTYAGGSERTVDATPFINARSKARRAAGRADQGDPQPSSPK
jgi:hypothetical protein